MIVIVEGADGSGKSTLVEQLQKIGFEYITAIPRNYPFQYEMYKTMFKAFSFNGDDAVFDRGFISELVYRCVKNDADSNITLEDVGNLLNEYEITVVYCSTENSYNFAKSRGEDYVKTQDEHAELCKTYDVIMKLINNDMYCLLMVEVHHFKLNKDNDTYINFASEKEGLIYRITGQYTWGV